MKVKVNNKDLELNGQNSLLQIVQTLELPDKGVAVAVNNRIVRREDWATYTVQENDQIIVIKAACGG